jgi:hypothetical protein
MNNSKTLKLSRPIAAHRPLLPSECEVPLETFWLIWSPDAYKPSKRFASEVSAVTEAKRLAALFPARAFHVYIAGRVR